MSTALQIDEVGYESNTLAAKCQHGTYNRRYCSLCPEFVGYDREPTKRTPKTSIEKAEILQCPGGTESDHRCPICMPYRNRQRKVKSWVVKKTDDNGHSIPAHLQRPRLQTEYIQATWPRPTLPIITAPTISHRPLRGWLGGLGAVDWGLLRGPKPNLLGNPIATDYYRWRRGLQYWDKAAIADLSPFLRWQGKDPKKMCWCSYKSVLKSRSMIVTVPMPDGEWSLPPREHLQHQPARKTRQQIFELFQFEPVKIIYENGWSGEIYPLSRARLRLMERGFSSFSKTVLEKIRELPYEPFELAYPFCERNPASPWPRVWVGPTVIRHTVQNSALGLEFTERTIADACRSYLISQPELAEAWGCSPRTVWTRLQGMECACRVCIAARWPEFKRSLYQVILPTISATWGSEIGSLADKAEQRRLDKKRKFERYTSEPTWGWDPDRGDSYAE